jgi:hypothetical protein
MRWGLRRRDALPLREAIPLWFAFPALNWSNDRTPRRLVRHLVDDLGNQQERDRKGMNKVIEADFLPRGTNAVFPGHIQSAVRKGKKEGAS